MKKSTFFAILTFFLAPACFHAPATAETYAPEGADDTVAPYAESGRPGWDKPRPAALAPKAWTIAFYMNGKNNLDRDMKRALESMNEYGSSDRTNIVIEYGSEQDGNKVSRMVVGSADTYQTLPNPGVRHYDDNGEWMYTDFPDQKTGRAEVHTLQTLSHVDMGDWREAADFLKFVKTRFPAKHYLFIMSSHGYGWKGVSYDDETKKNIAINELPAIFKAAGPVDIYVSQACLMQMAEVIYELAPYARIIIGSEEIEWSCGYDGLAEMRDYIDLSPDTDIEPAKVAKRLVGAKMRYYTRNYAGMYDIANHATTYSAVDTTAMRRLPALLGEWAKAVIAADDAEATAYAIKFALRFDFLQGSYQEKITACYGDLKHFVALLSSKSQNAKVKELGAKLLDFISHDTVLANIARGRYFDQDYRKAGGISIELPVRATIRENQRNLPYDQIPVHKFLDQRYREYARMSFARDSHWLDFLLWARKTYEQQNIKYPVPGEGVLGSGIAR